MKVFPMQIKKKSGSDLDKKKRNDLDKKEMTWKKK